MRSCRTALLAPHVLGGGQSVAQVPVLHPSPIRIRLRPVPDGALDGMAALKLQSPPCRAARRCAAGCLRGPARGPLVSGTARQRFTWASAVMLDCLLDRSLDAVQQPRAEAAEPGPHHAGGVPGPERERHGCGRPSDRRDNANREDRRDSDQPARYRHGVQDLPRRRWPEDESGRQASSHQAAACCGRAITRPSSCSISPARRSHRPATVIPISRARWHDCRPPVHEAPVAKPTPLTAWRDYCPGGRHSCGAFTSSEVWACRALSRPLFGAQPQQIKNAGTNHGRQAATPRVGSPHGQLAVGIGQAGGPMLTSRCRRAG